MWAYNFLLEFSFPYNFDSCLLLNCQPCSPIPFNRVVLKRVKIRKKRIKILPVCMCMSHICCQSTCSKLGTGDLGEGSPNFSVPFDR